MTARRAIGLLLIVLAGVACTAGEGTRALRTKRPALALVGGRVHPAPDAPPIADGVVVVEGHAIAAVGPRGTVTVRPEPPSSTVRARR
jgi:hypothetical protein